MPDPASQSLEGGSSACSLQIGASLSTYHRPRGQVTDPRFQRLPRTPRRPAPASEREAARAVLRGERRQRQHHSFDRAGAVTSARHLRRAERRASASAGSPVCGVRPSVPSLPGGRLLEFVPPRGFDASRGCAHRAIARTGCSVSRPIMTTINTSTARRWPRKWRSPASCAAGRAASVSKRVQQQCARGPRQCPAPGSKRGLEALAAATAEGLDPPLAFDACMRLRMCIEYSSAPVRFQRQRQSAP